MVTIDLITGFFFSGNIDVVLNREEFQWNKNDFVENSKVLLMLVNL